MRYKWWSNVRIIYEVKARKAIQTEKNNTLSEVSVYIESYFELIDQWNRFQHSFRENKSYIGHRNSMLCKLHLFLVTLKDVDSQLDTLMKLCKTNLTDKPKSKLSKTEKEFQAQAISKALRSVKSKGWYRWFKISQFEVILVENEIHAQSTIINNNFQTRSETNEQTPNSDKFSQSRTLLIEVIKSWCTVELSSPENSFVRIFARSGLYTFPTFCVLHVHSNSPSLIELRFYFFCCTSKQRYNCIEGIKEQLKNAGGKKLSEHLSKTNKEINEKEEEEINNNDKQIIISKKEEKNPKESQKMIFNSFFNIAPFYYETKPLYKLIVQYNNDSCKKENNYKINTTTPTASSQLNSSIPLHEQQPSTILSDYMLHKRKVWEIENSSTLKTIIEMIIQLRLKEGFLRVNNRQNAIHTFIAQFPLHKGYENVSCTFEYLLFKFPPNLLVTEFWMEPQYGCPPSINESNSNSFILPEKIFKRFYKSLAAVDKRIIISMWTFHKLKESNISVPHLVRRDSIPMNIHAHEKITTPFLCIGSVLSSALSIIQSYEIFHVSENMEECSNVMVPSTSTTSSDDSTNLSPSISKKNQISDNNGTISLGSSNNDIISKNKSLLSSNEILASMLEDELHSLSDCEIDTQAHHWHTLVVKHSRQRCRCFVKIVGAGVILAIVPMINRIEGEILENSDDSEDLLDFGDISDDNLLVSFYECSLDQLLQDSLTCSFTISDLTNSNFEIKIQNKIHNNKKDNKTIINNNNTNTKSILSNSFDTQSNENANNTIKITKLQDINNNKNSNNESSPFSAATKQYYFSLRYAYEHSYAKGIYTNIKENLPFTLTDFQKSIDYCREYPVEIDITQFFRILQKSSPEHNKSVSEYIHETFDGYLNPLFTLIEGTKYYYYSAEESIIKNHHSIEDSSDNEYVTSNNNNNNNSIIDENQKNQTKSVSSSSDNDDMDAFLNDDEKSLDEDISDDLKDDLIIMHSKTLMGVFPYPFFICLECQLLYSTENQNNSSNITQPSSYLPSSSSSSSNHTQNNHKISKTIIMNSIPTLTQISEILDIDASQITFIKVIFRIVRITLTSNCQSIAMLSVIDRLCDSIQNLISKEILVALMGVLPVTKPLLEIALYNLNRLTSSKKTVLIWDLYLLDSDLGESLLLNELEKCFYLPVKRIDDYLFVIQPINIQNFKISKKNQKYTIPYWLILSHKGTSIHITFFSQSLSNIERSRILSATRACIRSFNDRINQLILLNQLHDTHHCSDLLVPQNIQTNDNNNSTSTNQITSNVIHSKTIVSTSIEPSTSPISPNNSKSSVLKQNILTSPNSIQRLKTSSSSSILRKKKRYFYNHYHTEGQYECNLVHSIELILHSRVSGTLAISELINSSLNPFQVHNRRGLFVYQDQQKNVFYMKLLLSESTIEDHYDNQSSDNDNNQSSLDINTGSSTSKKSSSSKKIPCIRLDIYGLDSPGDEITKQLRKSLEDKLSNITVHSLSEILMRNPKLKLTNEDLKFLKLNQSCKLLKTKIPIPDIINSSIYLFLVHLMQILSQYFIHCNFFGNVSLKDSLDISDDINNKESSSSSSNNNLLPIQILNFRFIYNFIQNTHTPISSIIGPGLCFFQVYLFCSETNKRVEFVPPDPCSPVSLSSPKSTTSGNSIYFDKWENLCSSLWSENFDDLFKNSKYSLVFNCWNHSIETQRIDEFITQLRVCFQKTVIEHALEKCYFISKSSSDDVIPSDIAFHQQGFRYALAIQSPGVNRSFLTLNNLPSWSLISFLNELLFLLKQLISTIDPLLFYSHTSQPKKLFRITQLSEFHRTHPIQAHVKTQYCFYICFGTINTSSSQIPSHLKLYNPNPISNDSSASSSTNYSNSVYREAGILRKWFSFIKLTSNTLSFSSYNWSSGVMDELYGGFNRLLNWNDIRMHLLSSILHQKMGLLRHIPSGIHPPSSYSITPKSILQNHPLQRDSIRSSTIRPIGLQKSIRNPFSSNQIPILTKLPKQIQPVLFNLDNINKFINNKFPERIKSSTTPTSPTLRHGDNKHRSRTSSTPSNNTKTNTNTNANDLRTHNLLKFSPGFENVYRDSFAKKPLSINNNNEDNNDNSNDYHVNLDRGRDHINQFMTSALDVCAERQSFYFRKQILGTVVTQIGTTNTHTTKNPLISTSNLQRILTYSVFIHACRVSLLLLEIKEKSKEISTKSIIFPKFLSSYSLYLESLGVYPIDLQSDEFYYFYKKLHGGILLIEISLKEKFICTNLFAHRDMQIKNPMSMHPSRPFSTENDKTITQQIFFDESTKFKHFLHMNSFVYDYQLHLYQTMISNHKNKQQETSKLQIQRDLFMNKESLLLLFEKIIERFPSAPSYSRNCLLFNHWNFPISSIDGNLFIDFIIKNAENDCFDIIPSCDCTIQSALCFKWNLPSKDPSSSSSLQNHISILITNMFFSSNVIIFDFYITCVHPSKFLRENQNQNQKLLRNNNKLTNNQQDFDDFELISSEILIEKSKDQLQSIISKLYCCFVGGMIWDRLLHHPALKITLKEKDELFQTCSIHDSSDFDPSLSRLHSFHVPDEILIQSLERMNPSRIRFLPSSSEGKTEIIIIREKQLIHIINDHIKNSLFVYSCIRNPINPSESDDLHSSAIQHCSQLISHLCYILWSSLICDKI